MMSNTALAAPVCLMIAVLGLAGCKPAESEATDPRLSKRLVEVATAQPVAPTDVSYTGVVGARVESHLGFRVQGKVIARLVDTGQVVQKGEPLMRLDPTDYVNARVTREEEVAAARARWVQAAADDQRYRGLVGSGAVSKSAYDQAKAAADSARSLLDAAIAQERVARDQESYTTLVADADGTIVATLAEPGQVVAAGQVVARLAHAGPREAIVNLPETIRPAIGSLAAVSLYGGSVRVPAHLRQLSDAAAPQTRTFEARYVIDGAGATAPLGATVTLVLGEDPGTHLLSVPLGAIDDEGHGPGVWVVDAKTLKVGYRPVGVRSLGGDTVEISNGLTSGETVVATGGHYLHEGEPVRIASSKAAMQ